MNRFNLKLISALCLCLFAGISEAKVSASVNQTKIYENETLRLIIESDESGSPDLSKLSDFAILQRGQSQQMSCINGHCESKKEWSYVLKPIQNSQTLTIPAIAVGKSQTTPIQIEVLAGNNPNRPSNLAPNAQSQYRGLQTDEIIARYQIQNKPILVNQSSVFYLNVLIPENLVYTIQNVDLDFPQTDHLQFEKINQRFDEKWSIQNGVRYLDLAIPLQLTAIQSGEIKLDPIQFKIDGMQNGIPFNDTIASDSITLTIQPKPKDYPANEPFYPAQKMEVQSIWSPEQTEIKVGESIKQTVILHAIGLNTSQLAIPEMPELNQVKTYLGDKNQRPTWIADNQVNGQVEIERTFVPTQTGEMTFPEQRIPWWNLKTNQVEYAIIPAKTFTVIPNPALDQTKLTSGQSTQTPLVETETQTAIPTWLQWLLGVLALIILVLLYLLFKAKKAKPLEARSAQTKTRKQPTDLKQALKQACLANQAQQAKSDLEKLSQQNLFQLETALLDPTFKQAYENLNQALYGKSAVNWDGNAFWQAYLQLTQKSTQKKSAQHDDLPPIYPN